jgi:DNA-binding NarL/FixJ family response regulator
VICVSTTEDPDIAAEALRVGASAFVLKRLAAAELLAAVRAVMHGRSYVSPRGSAERPPLTQRQRDVLQLLGEGRSVREIATMLQITPQSVAFHRNRLMKRFGAATVEDLIRGAVAQRPAKTDKSS